MMTKRRKALELALALYRSSKQYDKEYPTMWGFRTLNFWFPNRRATFRTGAEARKLANSIAKQYLKKSET